MSPAKSFRSLGRDDDLVPRGRDPDPINPLHCSPYPSVVHTLLRVLATSSPSFLPQNNARRVKR